MLSSRYSSEHRLKHNLNESVRKERQLSNRITVLMIDKERRLKQIQRRMNQLHDQQGIKMQKAAHKEQIQRSFHQSQQIQHSNSFLSRNMKRGITSRQATLLQTKQRWYKQTKKTSQLNRTKIQELRQKQLQGNKSSNRRIKLMEMHSKENVKHYWKERVQCIQKERHDENLKASKLFESSLQNISILQQKEQKLLQEIHETLHQGQYCLSILQQQNESSW